MITAAEAVVQLLVLEVFEEHRSRGLIVARFRAFTEAANAAGLVDAARRVDAALATLRTREAANGRGVLVDPAVLVEQHRRRIREQMRAALFAKWVLSDVERALRALAAPPAWSECLRVEQARNCYSGHVDNARGLITYPAASMSDYPW